MGRGVCTGAQLQRTNSTERTNSTDEDHRMNSTAGTPQYWQEPHCVWMRTIPTLSPSLLLSPPLSLALSLSLSLSSIVCGVWVAIL